MEYQILAVHLGSSVYNPNHYHIEGVRCRYQDAFTNLWLISNFDRAYIADQISQGIASAFTRVDEMIAIVLAEHLNGEKYLRTVPDKTGKDNLLNLPKY